MRGTRSLWRMEQLERQFQQLWKRAGEELAVIDLRLTLEVDQARHELGEFVRTCRDVVEREFLPPQ